MRTAEDISTARLVALGLAGPRRDTALDVVTHLVCTQAQLLPGALVSVALRMSGRDPADVRAALNDGSLVRSWTQRGTIHLVGAADVGWILDLTADRMIRSMARRRAELGVDDAMYRRAEVLATELIRERGPVTRAELLAAMKPLGVDEVAGRAYYLIAMLLMRQVLVQGPLQAAQGGTAQSAQLFVLFSEWITGARRLDHTEAVAELMTRYAVGHGPATEADAARWTGLPVTEARAGLAAGLDSGALGVTEIEGQRFFHAPELPDALADHRAEAQGMFLLPGFDELILGYKDRTATLAAAHENLIVPGGNGIFKNTVIWRGRAVGTWLRSPRASGPPIEVTPFPGRRFDARALARATRSHPAFATP